MNFLESVQAVNLVLAANQVPLVVGETGIGKTALARSIADTNNWALVTIEGTLLKEGEIGGLPTIETIVRRNAQGEDEHHKTTVYAIHTIFQEIENARREGKEVLLFIDEINRCEHAVQQELMNLILNREINGYHLTEEVHIVGAMNPADTYEYQTIDMDRAQENRFVWIYMEADYVQWINWATEADLDPKVIAFIATYPDYLVHPNEDDIMASPRSYERLSDLYKLYEAGKPPCSRNVFAQIVRGNIGKALGEQFMAFIESKAAPLLTFEDVAHRLPIDEIKQRLNGESPTRLYLMAKNIGRRVESILESGELESTFLPRFLTFLGAFPDDLRIGVMKEMKRHMPKFYDMAIEDKDFVDLYYKAYRE